MSDLTQSTDSTDIEVPMYSSLGTGVWRSLFNPATICPDVVEQPFDRHKVFRMLLSKGKITQDLVNMLMNWRHSGFNVFFGPRIQPGDEKSMENLARYVVRASFSQERKTYIPQESKVLYQSKDGKEEKIFDALEWLAAMCSHVPNKGEQTVRYYGHYSNVACGKRKKQDQDGLIPSILEPDGTSKKYKGNWARLIQKIYEVDPLTCPRCSGKMKVISVIEDEKVIRKSSCTWVYARLSPDLHPKRPGHKKPPNTESTIPTPNSPCPISGFMLTLSIRRPFLPDF